MLHRIAHLAIAAPRRVLLVAALVMVAAGIFGIPVANSLSAGGFQDPTSESAQATQLLSDKFARGDMQLVISVTDDGAGADGPAARAVGTDIAGRLKASPYVTEVSSTWTVPPPPAATLISKDGKTGLILAGINGGESGAQKHAKELTDQLVHDRDGVTVRAGGEAMTYVQINGQSEKDLLMMESIAIPLSFVVLVWVFGGLLAAALPLAVGGFAILGSLAVLRGFTMVTDVSIFALNLTVAMGLALAIDYTLLIVSRYRDELADGVDPDRALVRTMVTAGRTVLFSAMTVALSMVAMVLFPMYFLKSFAYAGIAVVALAAFAAIVVAPAAIALLGDRLDAYDVRRFIRRILGRPDPVNKPVEQTFWYRMTKRVMRRALPVGLAVIALLLVLGAPFLGIKWGFPDDRVLPSSASARQLGDELRTDFAVDSSTAVTVVLPDVAGLPPAEIDRYAGELSRAADGASVSAPGGTFVDGRRVGPPTSGTGIADGSAYLTIGSNVPLFSDASEAQLDALHGVPAPTETKFTGIAQVNRDSSQAITSRLPMVLGIIAAITFVLLFLLTGSVILPLKALVLNVLSLSAAFGALVWIFQDGHLGALGTTSTGTLVANLPVLLFCIAFGLSMDYEVFLVSRIREYWLESGRTRDDGTDLAPRVRSGDLAPRVRNDESVALGLARTGRVVTAAALLMSISFAALIAAQVAFMRMFGLGLTIAVLVDATLVRMLLVPAFMHLMGQWNWWAPAPLARLHKRFGISESGPAARDPRGPGDIPPGDKRECAGAGVTDG
ncbi:MULTISPECIES: MMPL family transporter [Mycolicibacterium]|uniref:Transmembrane transport protein mmpL13a n=1 Tax=Mycolicibacterium senegalense TaxID=1796 RepID=A0A378SX39_9MYCO|nr:MULTISPECIES: MMPL family transporter [Mycolicibacterium]MCV7334700.1 MMPL family transporter [Mycolicibacterium senegalense]MDR7291827.1 RND superfamily putative drug exporter [Mycolicibacterium senegalense]QZA23267.1 MMPL family transporter [Mycolicibacterium senegalense]CDP89781.1 integral membrane protein [Mycolicibacterium farcinogenes]STZ53171.1 transmembrane transport protein mmpL13a [Mycolicibacterium senegalense]